MIRPTAPTEAPRAGFTDDAGVRGGFVTRAGRRLYQIDRCDRMAPFLMTVVSDSDLWMYLSSAGALTAGRVEPERCIFPYETDDRLHAAGGVNGPVTMIRTPDGSVWRPFDTRPLPEGRTRRLLRTPIGDAVIFEETDDVTGLTVRAEWTLSDQLGIVRFCEVELAPGRDAARFDLLDAWINIMSPNVTLGSQQGSSTLVDAYKRAELDADTTLAVYALEAAISDRPEARESLRANCVWRAGLEDASVTLDDDAIGAFESGTTHEPVALATGRRGAYVCTQTVELGPGERLRWALVGDVHLAHAGVVARREWLASGVDRLNEIAADLSLGDERLGALLDQADGSQVTSDEPACAAHRSSVLFNAMRGGVPAEGYLIDPSDFASFCASRHARIADRHKALITSLGERVSLPTLMESVGVAGDPHLQRLAWEYLPLTFGRRHGDPSRPWNRFRVRVRHADGSRALGYEGNWRDIFQNWEAMAVSYPAYLPGMIAKFVNASTPDGHNPYRVSEGGIDWEVPDEHDPWSNIGYWGDHQLIYLLRLLEGLRDAAPSALDRMLEHRAFTYADLPYVIRPFDDLVRDPKSSIEFDRERHERIVARSAEIGSDGRLVLDSEGEPHLVSLIEKLIVPVLAKVSSLVPGGGVWMNTQRPEWNDANNALTGFGLSMVTLYQLRRFADFCERLLRPRAGQDAELSAAMGAWCDDLLAVLREHAGADAFDDGARWRFLEGAGRAGERARERVRSYGLGDPETYPVASIADMLALVRDVCDTSIRTAIRPDGLYESYNVLNLDARAGTAGVERLHPMLEGQVTVLASGVLPAGEALRVLTVLFESELYRPDQKTFILYPRVDRPAFIDRNVIPEDAIDASPLLTRSLQEGVIELASRDPSGRARFNADLESNADLDARLESLARRPGWGDLVTRDANAVRDAYERTFEHARFTGRSGTMHKYEGLGSVYWHMVSKLLLAVQESAFDARDAGEPKAVLDTMVEMYRRVRDGLGMNKTPTEFGAVPHEPYSHTPWHTGAQQPGMTGQVKESILSRLGELGVRFADGCLRLDPLLFDRRELLENPATWRVTGPDERTLELDPGTLGLTVCGVPLVISTADRPSITVVLDEGNEITVEGETLDASWTGELQRRTGRIERIIATISP